MAKSLARDRAHFSVLVVCQKGATSSQIRQAMKALGFVQISTAPSHVAAIQRVKTRPFTHVLFDARASDMPAIDFVTQMLELETNAILIAVSEQPRIDDVFSLLRVGGRGFLVPPFTTDQLEEVLLSATEGPKLSEAVLNAPDRNGAFTAVILNNLYRLSVSMRQAREFTSALRDVSNYDYQLKESVELALLFCDGDEAVLRDKIIEGCINRAKDAATRLGRLRKRLRKERGADGLEFQSDDEEDDPRESESQN